MFVLPIIVATFACCVGASHPSAVLPMDPTERELVWGLSPAEQERVRMFIPPCVRLGLDVAGSIKAKLFIGLLLPGHQFAARRFSADQMDTARTLYHNVSREMVADCKADLDKCQNLRDFLSRSILARAMFIKFSVGESHDPLRAYYLVSDVELRYAWVPGDSGVVGLREAASGASVEVVFRILSLPGSTLSSTLIALLGDPDTSPSERPPRHLAQEGGGTIGELGIAR